MVATILRYWLGGLTVAVVSWVALCHLAPRFRRPAP